MTFDASFDAFKGTLHRYRWCSGGGSKVTWKHENGDSILVEHLKVLHAFGARWLDSTTADERRLLGPGVRRWYWRFDDSDANFTTEDAVKKLKLGQRQSMPPSEMLMQLSLAEADIQFAKSKCCQAELARVIGFGSVEQNLTLAAEAAGRAASHLEGMKRDDPASEVTNPMGVIPHGG